MLKLLPWRRWNLDFRISTMPSPFLTNISRFLTHSQSVSSDLPFDFQYSYSETNSAIEPIGFREPPKFSPFGPGRLNRKWTGTCAPAQRPADLEKVAEERQAVLGEPLSEEEIAELVEKYRYNTCSR